MPFKILFRPLFLPTLITSILLVVLFSLGTWQIHRKLWKEDLLKKEDLIWERPPLPWKESNLLFHVYTKIQDFPFRRLELRGYFLEEPVVLVPALLPSLSKDKKNMYESLHGFLKQKKLSFYGYRVIQPFFIEQIGIIWVDRGWIPSPSILPRLQKEMVFIQVRLEEEPKPSFLQKKMGFVNKPDQGKWIYFSPQQASQAYKVKTSYDFYAVMTENPYEGLVFFPLPMLEKKKMRNQHLTYALIWYSLGILVSLGYLIFHKQQGKLEFLWMFKSKES